MGAVSIAHAPAIHAMAHLKTDVGVARRAMLGTAHGTRAPSHPLVEGQVTLGASGLGRTGSGMAFGRRGAPSGGVGGAAAGGGRGMSLSTSMGLGGPMTASTRRRARTASTGAVALSARQAWQRMSRPVHARSSSSVKSSRVSSPVVSRTMRSVSSSATSWVRRHERQRVASSFCSAARRSLSSRDASGSRVKAT